MNCPNCKSNNVETNFHQDEFIYCNDCNEYNPIELRYNEVLKRFAIDVLDKLTPSTYKFKDCKEGSVHLLITYTNGKTLKRFTAVKGGINPKPEIRICKLKRSRNRYSILNNGQPNKNTKPYKGWKHSL